MHDQRSYPRPAKGTAAHQDWSFQRAVLENVIDLHPVQLTISELIREIALDPEDFATRDGIERGVFDLASIGLLHHGFIKRKDSLVVPARAALHIHALLLDD